MELTQTLDRQDLIAFAAWQASRGRQRVLIQAFDSEATSAGRAFINCVDASAFADAIADRVNRWEQRAKSKGRYITGVYFCTGPFPESASADFGTSLSKELVTAVDNLMLDVDAPNHGATPADEAGKALAFDVFEAAAEYLCGTHGWPDPTRIDSGNGPHGHWKTALENTESNATLRQQLLLALKRRFGIHVDASTFNANRLARLPGTWNRKGEASEQRPHRVCTFVAPPPTTEAIVTAEMIQKVIDAISADFPPDDALPRENLNGVDLEVGYQWNSNGDPPPGERFNREANWSDILHPAGWKAAYTSKGVTYWTRPGKKKGVSGTTGYLKDQLGNDKFKVFTDAADAKPFEGGMVYSKFYAITLLKYGGDFTAAASALRKDQVRNDLESQQQDAGSNDVEEEYEQYMNGLQEEGASEDEPQILSSDAKPKRAKSKSNSGKKDPRTRVLVDPFDFRATNERIIPLLGRHQSVFQRGCKLVNFVRASTPKGRCRSSIYKAEGTPVINVINSATLRVMMSDVARFFILKENKQTGLPEPHQVSVPGEAAGQILAQGEWGPKIRHLEAIVETPEFLPDGSILTTPGYHEDSGLLYLPSLTMPTIDSAPSPEEAQAAAKWLLEIVADFPFEMPHHAAAWLSSLLTGFAHHAIDGPMPLFVFDANSAGSGKSLLCDINAYAHSGRPMPRGTWPDNDVELRKLLLALAVEGAPMVLWDNIGEGQTLGSPALDAVLTSRTYRDRILGKSETSKEIPWHAQQYSTGNNIVIGGDTERRVVYLRLLSRVERPEERTGFKIPNLLAFVQENRANMVAACLTILRAFHVAGRPLPPDLSPFGSFEEWSALIRGAVIWTTGLDPCAGREAARKANAKKSVLPAFLEGWEQLPNATTRGITSKEAIKLLEPEQVHVEGENYQPNPHRWFAELVREEIGLDGRSLGGFLKAHKDKISGGRQLVDAGEVSRYTLWKVVHLS